MRLKIIIIIIIILEFMELKFHNFLAGLRLILFGFDSFKFEVASGLVLPLRFGFEVCVWFLRKYKKIWVLSLGPKIWIWFLCLMFWWCGGLNLIFLGFKFAGFVFCWSCSCWVLNLLFSLGLVFIYVFNFYLVRINKLIIFFLI